MRIIPYERKYRDDMIFMVLESKDALGQVPTLNEDLLDIEGHYFARGDPFWLSLDERDRVIGCIGYNTMEKAEEVMLHRLYVKASRKRQGIGSALLKTAEEHAKVCGKRVIHVHLGDRDYWESYLFYPKHGYEQNGERYMRKVIL